MLHDHSEISVIVKGISTVVIPYGVKSVKEKIHLHDKQLHTADLKESSEYLLNAFVGWVEDTPVIRSGIINTKDKANAFLGLALKVHHDWCEKTGNKIDFRLASCQLNYAEFEWNEISAQHQCLIFAAKELEEKGGSMIHLSTPVDDFYSLHPHVRELKRELQAFDKLPKLMNMESWVVYCSFYNDILQDAFRRFSYDATDEYTLEQYLEYFKHEVKSNFLDMNIRRIKELEFKLGTSQDLVYSEQVELEKALLTARNEVSRMMRVQYDHLAEIVRLIRLIERAHPELVDIKFVGRVLDSLIGFEVDVPMKEMPLWAENQILLQLLDDELGVISAVNCEHGVDRTNIAFALRLAALQVKKLTSSHKTIDLALHFELTARRLNKIAAKEGSHALKTKVAEHQDTKFKNRARLLMLFRKCFMKNLIKICQPITAWNTKGELPVRDIEYHENAQHLDIFPHHYVLLNEIGELEKQELVTYDPKTGAPLGFTEAGHRFISSLSLTLHR